MPPHDVSIALLTDFGYRDHYVGVMKGVITSIAPRCRIIDITHGIPPQQIAAGALALAQSWRFFPAETIFVAVVDPGVGSARLPIAITTKAGARLIGPDNGLLSPVADAAGIKTIVRLENPRYRLAATSSTFHGRDIFAPAAAWLARGIRLRSLGPELASMVRIDLDGKVREGARQLRGEVIYIDTFGNLVTNLTRGRVMDFAERCGRGRLLVDIGGSRRIGLRKTYADVAVGAPVAVFGSFETLEIAIRDGSAAARFKRGVGSPVVLKTED